MKLRVRNPVSVAGMTLEPWMVALPVVVVGGGVLAYGITRVITTLGSSLPPGVVPPASVANVPFAAGLSPVWPVRTNNRQRGVVSYRDVHGNYHGNYARRFGASRDSRNHVGVDVYANYNDPVVAMDDGVVTSVQNGFHLGSSALFVDHGPIVVMYGEITPGSWKRHGVSVGSRVKRGQVIANIACMVWKEGYCKSHMLHLETYRPGTKRNKRWFRGKRPSAAILDPTRLLLQASAHA